MFRLEWLSMMSWTELLTSVLPRRLVYFDVGAREGLVYPWSSFRHNVAIVGFEPDSSECERLQHDGAPHGDTYLATALYKESKELELYLTNSRGCSSIYRPNFGLLANYPEVERFKIEKTVRVAAAPLDGLYGENGLVAPDFIKIDAQGAELAILEGGRSLLAQNAVGLEVEVEFAELYEGQPMFADIDGFVRRELGFQLQDIRKTYWKLNAGAYHGGIKGQLIFGDALYMRSLADLFAWLPTMDAVTAGEKLRMAMFVALAYGYADYVLGVLSHTDRPRYMADDELQTWRKLLARYGRTFRLLKDGHPALAGVFRLLYGLFQTCHNGWASSEPYLGSRKKWGLIN
jgi:FkbM family methyltransferase